MTKTPTQIMDEVRSGTAYIFKGAIKTQFKLTHNGNNYVLEMPDRKGKRVKRAISLTATETVVFNSLNN